MPTTQPSLSWLDQPMVTQVNRKAPHATLSRTLPDKNPVQKLNGTWQGSFNNQPDVDLPSSETFMKPEAALDNFAPVQIPAHFQMQGFGQKQYTNTAYPWDGIETVPYGKTPTQNPHARYVLDFDLDPNLASDQIDLVFHGVESAFYVWLNGEFVGYSTDSFTPSAFDVTSLIKEKGNRLAVLVYQYSSGSWLEDQDFFRFGGIFRDVELQGRPVAHIEDLSIRTELNDDFKSGSIVAEIDDKNASAFTIRLYNPDGDLMFVQTVENRSIRLFFDDVELWSAENPALYTLEIDVLGQDGQVSETVTQKVGMRRIEIVDGVMLLNGKRLMLHGVNRHEFAYKTGRVVSCEQIESDLKLMKQNNINAVRTSHYPNSDALYDLADELGLYVMDETNLETHGTWQAGFAEEPTDPLPGNKPEWKKAVLERAQAMVERDKNHPSILIWSLGNESWYGDVLLEEAAWMRIKDPDRIVHYESSFRSDEYAECSDLYSRMYTSPQEIESILMARPDRPVILCEYMHAMGNSLGGMYRYSRLEEYRQYQGGFIWDWADQALPVTKNGIEMKGYGGDFGDRPNNGNFSGNGLLFADHTPSAKMQEVKALYAPLRLVVNPQGVEILNTNLFTDTSQYHFIARQKVEDEVIYEEEFDVRIRPGQYVHVDLDWQNADHESVCTVEAVLAQETDWAEAGHPIAFGQKILHQPDRSHVLVKGMKFIEGKEYFGAQYGDIRFLFNQKGLVSIRKGEQEWLEAMPRPVFSHAYTDNERGFEFDKTSAAWYAASQFAKTTSRSIHVDEEQGFAQVIYKLSLPYPFAQTSEVTLTYLISAPGIIGVRLEMPASRFMPDLPVFGMEFKLPRAADEFVYYGFGPMENYRDRSCGARLDVFEDNAENNLQPYLKPQETGNRTGVRWVDLKDGEQTLRFSKIRTPFECSVLPYSFEQLQDAEHQEELPASTGTYVRIASEHMGVGGVDSWGFPVDESDRLSASHARMLNFLISFDPALEQLEQLEAAKQNGEESASDKTEEDSAAARETPVIASHIEVYDKNAISSDQSEETIAAIEEEGSEENHNDEESVAVEDETVQETRPDTDEFVSITESFEPFRPHGMEPASFVSTEILSVYGPAGGSSSIHDEEHHTEPERAKDPEAMVEIPLPAKSSEPDHTVSIQRNMTQKQTAPSEEQTASEDLEATKSYPGLLEQEILRRPRKAAVDHPDNEVNAEPQATLPAEPAAESAQSDQQQSSTALPIAEQPDHEINAESHLDQSEKTAPTSEVENDKAGGSAEGAKTDASASTDKAETAQPSASADENTEKPMAQSRRRRLKLFQKRKARKNK